VADRKTYSAKAPLWLIPARPLRAISAAFVNGNKRYAPYSWVGQPDGWRHEYSSALRRHVEAFTDPTEPDYADDSGIHHLAHAGACILILLRRLGVDYPAIHDDHKDRA